MRMTRMNFWNLYYECPITGEGLFDVPDWKIVLVEGKDVEITFWCHSCEHHHTIPIPLTSEEPVREPTLLDRAIKLSREIPHSPTEVYEAMVAGATDEQIRMIAHLYAQGAYQGNLADAYRLLASARYLDREESP